MSTEGETIEAVSQREFARRVGCAHRSVALALQRGDIPEDAVLEDGRLNFSRALTGWTARDSREYEGPKLAGIRAQLLELEYLKQVGRLIDVEDMRRANCKIFRMTRDQLLNVADQLAPLVAVEQDPARVRDLIFRAIETALLALSRWAELEAAAESEEAPE